MTGIVIACYRPKPGREAELRQIVSEHVPLLRAEGLATERTPVVMRASDGTWLEIFEWKSAKAAEDAHSNPAVRELWSRFSEVSDFTTIGSLREAGEPFSHFEPVEL